MVRRPKDLSPSLKLHSSVQIHIILLNLVLVRSSPKAEEDMIYVEGSEDVLPFGPFLPFSLP